MREISKPAETVFWCVTNGTIVHFGRTEPTQVTTTNFETVVEASSIRNLLVSAEAYRTLLPDLPQDPQPERFYRENDAIVYVDRNMEIVR